MSLLVVGTLAFDSVTTPFGHRDATLGGSASFLATAASYFTQVRLVGVIGEDFPSEHLDFFQSRHIDTQGIRKLSGKTFRWAGHYDHNLNNAQTLDTQLNVLTAFDGTVPASYQDTEYVVLGNIDPTLQLHVLEQLPRRKFVACDTMNYWIQKKKPELEATLKHVDLLSVNDGEARALSDEYNLVRAAEVIKAMGPTYVIIKRGEYGALLFTPSGIFAAPAYPLEVIQDPTGAGDSFAGGLMGYITKMKTVNDNILRQAVITGSAMASFAVEDFSLDRFRALRHDEIEHRMLKFKHLTSY